jgi:hypothetical protein
VRKPECPEKPTIFGRALTDYFYMAIITSTTGIEPTIYYPGSRDLFLLFSLRRGEEK